MGSKLSVTDLDLKGKKALIRVDFNVPLDQGRITDDTRIQASLPTIQYILDQGGAVILMSHLGRPKGGPSPDFSLKPCAKRLSELLKRPVQMAPDCRGQEVEELAERLQPGQVLMLENLRFHEGEEHPEKEPELASALADLADVYVNDAFGTAHRAHTSTTEVPKLFTDKAASGFLLEKEIQYLGNVLLNPKRPFCAILGGAKISTKFKVIQALMQKADVLLIGGAMAYTFFAAQKIPIGRSLIEPDYIEVARQILEVDEQSRCRLLLPTDLVVAESISSNAHTQLIEVSQGVPQGFQGVDIGPKTIEQYINELKKAVTIFWNGPLGVFECPPFDKGTNEIAKAMARLPQATTVIGGGDTIAAVEAVGVADRMSHLSTGGGASLEYIEFGELPGIEILSNKSR